MNKLPKSVIDLIAILGETEALMFVQRYGGTQVYIPRYKDKEPPFDKLSKVYGGTYLFVPKCKSMIIEQRNLKIKITRNEGMSITDLAREYGVTDRQIYAICNTTTAPGALYI